jgi:hypothetical protein
MQRRDLLTLLGTVALGPVLAPLAPARRLALAESLHAQVAAGQGLGTLSPAEADLVRDIAEAIIPRTDSPGATDARVAEFVDLLLTEWYSPEERDPLLAGLAAIDTEGQALGGTGFLGLPPERRQSLLLKLDATPDRPDGSAAQAVARLKQLTVYGFFTSEAAADAGLTGPVIPGRFDGCAPIGGR